jgi:cardiolipin synthase A/B
MLVPIAIAVILTLFGTILVLNLSSAEKQIRYEITHRFAVSDPQFLRTVNHLLGPSVVAGNRVTALQNGAEIFPAMLSAIGGALQTITFETHIYWSGEIGRK